MSKELTEQWRNGTLHGGWYFLEFENGAILPVYYCELNREFEFKWDWKISKVLLPASYDQFVELIKKVHILNEANMQLENAIGSQADYFRQKISVLESKLSEVNEVIKFYANTDGLTEEEKQMSAEKYHLVYGLKAYDYIERYGVK